MSRKCKVCERRWDLWLCGRAWCSQCLLAWQESVWPHPEHRGEVVNDHLLCKCVRP